jgi:hypothetical protein
MIRVQFGADGEVPGLAAGVQDFFSHSPCSVVFVLC